MQVRLGEGHENKAREDEVAGQLVVLVDGDQGLHLQDKGSSSGSQPGVLLFFEVSSSRCRHAARVVLASPRAHTSLQVDERTVNQEKQSIALCRRFLTSARMGAFARSFEATSRRLAATVAMASPGNYQVHRGSTDLDLELLMGVCKESCRACKPYRGCPDEPPFYWLAPQQNKAYEEGPVSG